ncbi:hypothetical protein D918_10119 [Trichuris suis]|nr:hypothetical protein D918_10119 [Trichuris suis]
MRLHASRAHPVEFNDSLPAHKKKRWTNEERNLVFHLARDFSREHLSRTAHLSKIQHALEERYGTRRTLESIRCQLKSTTIPPTAGNAAPPPSPQHPSTSPYHHPGVPPCSPAEPGPLNCFAPHYPQ